MITAYGDGRRFITLLGGATAWTLADMRCRNPV
jgi:hypothetical protein